MSAPNATNSNNPKKRPFEDDEPGIDNSHLRLDTLPLFSSIVEYLEPLDLLACLHVSKASRKIAAHYWNNVYKPSAALSAQQQLLEAWLDDPEVGRLEENEATALAGPFRPECVRFWGPGISGSALAILDYSKSHQKEEGLVALVSQNGQLRDVFKWTNISTYESSVDSTVRRFEDQDIFDPFNPPPPMNQIELKRFDQARWEIRMDAGFKWDWGAQGGYQFLGMAVFGNSTLYGPFLNIFSPTESLAILLHALSSDSRSITEYLRAFRSCFYETNIDLMLDELVEEGNMEVHSNISKLKEVLKEEPYLSRD